MKVTKNNPHVANLLNSLFDSKADSVNTQNDFPNTKEIFVTPIKVICDFAINRLINNGGFTISRVGLVLIYGYALSIYKNRERKHKRLQPDIIAKYMETNIDLLSLPHHFLGGWKFQNYIYLDVSIVLQSLEKAKRLAKQHKQIAIFSLYENIDLISNKFFNKT